MNEESHSSPPVASLLLVLLCSFCCWICLGFQSSPLHLCSAAGLTIQPTCMTVPEAHTANRQEALFYVGLHWWISWSAAISPNTTSWKLLCSALHSCVLWDHPCKKLEFPYAQQQRAETLLEQIRCWGRRSGAGTVQYVGRRGGSLHHWHMPRSYSPFPNI